MKYFEPAKGGRDERAKGWHFLGAGTIVMMIGLWIAMEGPEILLRRAAKEELLEHLKAPTSAKSRVLSVEDKGGNQWAVIVQTDSQNAFGAMIRSNYRIEMARDFGRFNFRCLKFEYADPDEERRYQATQKAAGLPSR